MANVNNNNPDLVYLKSRDDLLQYEDARLNSLLQSVANFYTTRNDQSIWGNFLRAIAIELAKIDFDYSYDLVNKDPRFLTPSDIRRRWSDPLYVSSNWPALGQLDLSYKQMLVELIAAYREGTTVKAIQDVIFAYTGIEIKVVELYKEIGNGIFDQSDRNAISVSVIVGGSGSNPLTTVTSLSQLQIIVQSLYNAIALAKPAHVGLEFTTVFGETEDLECILSPAVVTAQQIVELPTDETAFFTFTSYSPINPALFWKASTPFALNNLLRDSNGNFQLLTSIGAFPNNSGITVPLWSNTSLEFTADNDLTWKNISPSVVSTSVASNVVTVTLSYPVGLSIGSVVKLINLGTSTFLNGVSLLVSSVNGATFTANFTHANYATTPESSGTATFALPQTITAIQFNQLNSTWQSLYQKIYTNTNCQASGISDTLRIFVKQVEQPPFGPMLIQAPVFDPKNPKTTIAAYGRVLLPKLSPTQWAALPTVFVNIINGTSDGVNATYTYIPQAQFLHEGELVTVQGFSITALNQTAPIKDVFNLVANIGGTAIASNVLTVTAPNTFVPGMLFTLQGTAESFLNGQTLTIVTASPTNFTANFTHANYTNNSDSGTAEVSTFQMPCSTVVALEAPLLTTNAGMLSPTLQSAYYLQGTTYILGTAPINLTGAGIGSSWNPNSQVFQGQIVVDSSGNTQLALNAGVTGNSNPTWNASKNGTTVDGMVNWRNVGRNTFSAPNNWVQILNMATNQPTGEVGNWDSLHQYGLLAPRLDQVWEISEGDQDFIFGLF
jgi:hypothetical protein